MNKVKAYFVVGFFSFILAIIYSIFFNDEVLKIQTSPENKFQQSFHFNYSSSSFNSGRSVDCVFEDQSLTTPIYIDLESAKGSYNGATNTITSEIPLISRKHKERFMEENSFNEIKNVIDIIYDECVSEIKHFRNKQSQETENKKSWLNNTLSS